MSDLAPSALTHDLLTGILARIPEGVIATALLGEHFGAARVQSQSLAALAGGGVARWAQWFYDRTRLTPEQVRELTAWCQPELPELDAQGAFTSAPIMARRAERATHVAAAPQAVRVLAALWTTPGYAPASVLGTEPELKDGLAWLVERGALVQWGAYVFDPLRIGPRTAQAALAAYAAAESVLQAVRAAEGQALPVNTIGAEFGTSRLRAAQHCGWLITFDVRWKQAGHAGHAGQERKDVWLRWWGGDAQAALTRAQVVAAQSAALAAQSMEERWATLLPEAGTALRAGVHDSADARTQVKARTYLLGQTAQRLELSERAIERAVEARVLPSMRDPDGHVRIPVQAVEAARADDTAWEGLAGYEAPSARELALVSGVALATMRRRLEQAGFNRKAPLWKDVRGQWSLPEHWREFAELALARTVEPPPRERERAPRGEERGMGRTEALALAQTSRREQAVLRAKLVAAFPAWETGRADQRVVLHVGPPNSGKTHHALDALAQAGSGWYLAPLRLLAFEVFDRLNQRGVLCNLLTGEEFIPVAGARITAATIEMFDPTRSGECVVIDEAQMLADLERGWAWTRAFMEARAPLIHVIAPPHAHRLVVELGELAALPVEIVPHERLAPIRVADAPWSLATLRPRTILVAFSRRTVLALKTTLEEMKRTVAVVYGDLPPEVRRRQSDRFASGEAEICVATDAVGMGMNLPADAVCFYEVEKFDGKAMRFLSASEVQQIGGRAGRFGLSQGGEIGAVSAPVLQELRRRFHMVAEPLRVARVAPTLEDLELLPGSLGDRLAQWAALRSIPEHLRGKVATVDLQERIELARLLSDEDVVTLGLGSALRLVNAPTRQETRQFWRGCVGAILRERAMPLPPQPPAKLTDRLDLESAEFSIHAADVYLWLSQRREFTAYAPHHERVRADRTDWSRRIDDALARKIDVSATCSVCGKRLPLGYRFGLCQRCYYSGARGRRPQR